MIDIHCHILPGVDDGAENLETALRMAKMAADSGVQVILATPHCNLPGAPYENFATQELLDRFLQFREAVEQSGIPLQVGLGAEVLCTPGLEDLLRRNLLPSLAATRYLLVEFYFDESLSYMEDRLSCVAASGLIPVVAHPERYSAVQRNPFAMAEWFDRGWVLQINKGSLLGKLGRGAETASNWLMAQGLAHVIASDGHGYRGRTPHMGQISRFLEEHCPPRYADILLNQNPLRILQDRPLVGRSEL